MARITITLANNERDALIGLAEQEKRDPRAQAALIIQKELKRRGLISRNNLASGVAMTNQNVLRRERKNDEPRPVSKPRNGGSNSRQVLRVPARDRIESFAGKQP